MDIIQQAVIFPRRKMRFTSRVSREFSLGILLIILILVVPTFINAVQSAYTPTTIASASLPVRGAYPDWIQALTWMNNNLPSTSVVFAWWDYGYWISVNTGLHTLADNGTGNLTQIQIIATGLLLNESMSADLLRQYGVTHVAVFASYNYVAGGSPLCSAQAAGAPPFCGYGDDSKWYWMTRIGNGTVINTPMGLANVTYHQVITNAQNGASDYYRYIRINGKTDNGTRITSNFQNVQIPTSNTLLGLLMRDSYPTSIASQYQVSQDTTNIAGLDTKPWLFTRVFQSTNDYVLVYKVNYPQTPKLTTMLNNPCATSSGCKANITGTLTFPNGQPVTSTTVRVHLQYSTDKLTWNPIANENITSSGTYAYNNWPVPTGSSQVYVRAWWNGDPTLSLDVALSSDQQAYQ
ncbi:MAG TPA: hypothetical protein VFV92_10395, partial [Candidatus Bathyarchaeia archaeon]|nr:hypothetical protein [Candidatus Bathyarchaeia archaeon]